MVKEVICRQRTTRSYTRSTRPRVRVSNINPPMKNRIGAYFSCFSIKLRNWLFLNFTKALFIPYLATDKFKGKISVGLTQLHKFLLLQHYKWAFINTHLYIFLKFGIPLAFSICKVNKPKHFLAGPISE